MNRWKRGAAAGDAIRIVRECYEAEDKAVSKGSAEYTREFRLAILNQRLNEFFYPTASETDDE